MKKVKIVLALLLAITFVYCAVDAALIYHQKYVPETPDGTLSRFWTSVGAATNWTVTVTDRDTVAANGDIISIDIPLDIGVFSDEFVVTGKKNKSIASEIYFVGEYIRPMTYPTPCVDSVTMTYWYVSENGDDMKMGGMDTLVFDTTGLVSATALTGAIPFVFKLGATELEGNAFIGDLMRFELDIIDIAPANDTLLLDNCAILARWTN